MMSAQKHRHRRAILKSVVALGVIAGLTALLMSAFRFDLSTGLAWVVGGLVVYSVPATVFHWPRLTWADVMSTIWALASAIGAAFLALVGW
jgi:predicted membrane channel-forming protein YqfA (hemolysin III family)